MLTMANVFRSIIIVLLSFVFSSSLLAAPKRSKADSKDYTVINALVETLDGLGDTCSNNLKILGDPVEAQKIIDLSFWLWNLPGVDKSEMIINIECFSRANNEAFRKELNELSLELQNEIKNALKKHKEKGESNA